MQNCKEVGWEEEREKGGGRSGEDGRGPVYKIACLAGSPGAGGP